LVTNTGIKPKGKTPKEKPFKIERAKKVPTRRKDKIGPFKEMVRYG